MTAAFRYRDKNGANSKILVIDNHDDFGGHAKRVEFYHNGKTYMVPGGSVFMETPYFSEQSRTLLEDIGVHLEQLEPGQVKDFRLHAFNMNPAICFDKETYGEEVTLVGDFLPMNRKDRDGNFVLLNFISDMPIPELSKKELHDFLIFDTDVFENLTSNERKSAIRSMSYNTFVTEYCGLSQETADTIFTRHSSALLGLTTECTSLHDAFFWLGLPGLHRLGEQGAEIQKEIDSMPPIEGHYAPDGNAIITRNLIKRLVPEVANAETMQELTTARFDYARLDEETSKARIRLNSMAVNIETVEKDNCVAITYIRGGEAYRVRAKHCIYAGYHMYLPYLCPELPAQQKNALKANVKMPFIAVDVFLRSGKPLEELGAASFYFPGRILHECLGYGRSLGKHEQDFDPDEPVVIYMIGCVIHPHSGLRPQEQYRRGKHELLSMKFEDYEIEVRQQLASLFKSTSFNVKEDIIGITVNRWPHGYTRQYNSLFDPQYEQGQLPHEIARKKFGRIAIANSDASYVALCNTAIDEGLRAVDELLS